ncbi:acyltransferase [Vibrio tapetis subsp. quintayensis]|uniref:acyltransferase n=1 Tax=Vibrio tapetis TaxID=52443 RepID=UPI0025B37CEC|nr:acyltransferase [Vibrio tapetis]MDN3680944.1 acyltransferase [Vibrio tapetis subsp. quintayensis]
MFTLYCPNVEHRRSRSTHVNNINPTDNTETMIIKRPELTDFVTLFQEIIAHVRDDTVKIFPIEKYRIIELVEQLVSDTLEQQRVEVRHIHQALELVERLSVVINLKRYDQFNLLLERARSMATYLLNNDEPLSCQDDEKMHLLFSYLMNRQMISRPTQLTEGNGLHIATAYRKGLLNLSEAIDAYRAQLACQQRLQFVQLQPR